MKNNKVLIIIGVILVNILVIFMIAQSFMGKETEYDIALREARAYSEKELCSKAMEKYNKALIEEDTLALRIEMLDVYEKGMEIGEFRETYDIFTFAEETVETYREDPAAYERVSDLYMKNGKYEECANILMEARKLFVTSEKIEEYREAVRYKYVKNFSMFNGILPAYDGMYVAQNEEIFRYLTETGSGAFDGSYKFASGFSEGYAFVTQESPDGTLRSFIIDKNGQRQTYFDGIDESSGFGRVTNSEGIITGYLLACKSGDKYGYYDGQGEKKFGEYAFAGRFRNNVAAVMIEEGKWQLIGVDGKPVTDTVFEDVILNEYDECAPKGLIFAKSNGEYRLYNTKAEPIGKFTCDYAKAFVDGFAAFQKDGVWGFVDSEGKVVIEPQFEDAKSFSNGLGGALGFEGWTLIKSTGESVTDETFEDVDYLNASGVCFIKQNGYWSSIRMYYTGE